MKVDIVMYHAAGLDIYYYSHEIPMDLLKRVDYECPARSPF